MTDDLNPQPALVQPLVELSGVSRNYGNVRAVNNLSFVLHPGEILGFLGPNGAGKSTTMQMICGTLAPSAGSITIDGIDLLTDAVRAKQHIGYLPENPPVDLDATVDEYLHFCAQLHNVKKLQIAAALDSVKQRCGLTDVGKRLIGTLSKGYQQRVGIAQALVHSPRIVVLDEPTVGLDPVQIRDIRNLIREIGRDHGVILSTHILPEVQMVCNRVQIINHGELVFNNNIEHLNKQMQASRLLISCRQLPSEAELANLPGVQQVDMIDKQRARLHYANEQNPAEILVERSVQEHWGLQELIPESHSLEQVFMNLIATDQIISNEVAA
ncbi:MAG: ATP-binding cassette domain-containing protein [Gammaproteobacteria bacterium]|nr:ATP-binding cassette domain-containing protein [Gammaproteobacteria bacterium]